MQDKTVEDEIREKLPEGEHGRLIIPPSDEYTAVFTTDENEIFDKIKKYVINSKRSAYTKDDIIEEPDHFLYFSGNIKAMVCAHVDTVNYSYPKIIYITDKTNIITAGPGESIGGDDRAGVLGIYEIVRRGMKPHLLFTKGEESGMGGAKAAAKLLKKVNISKKINFIIALDRVGKNEAAYYNNDNTDFKKWVSEFKFKEVRGTGNDIRVLCPEWGISGANLSIGYEKPHTKNDYVSIPVLMHCISRVIDMLKECPDRSFPFVENKQYVSPRKWYDFSTARVCPLRKRYYSAWNEYYDYDDEDKDVYLTETVDYDDPDYEIERGRSIRNASEYEKLGTEDYSDYFIYLSNHIIPIPPFSYNMSYIDLNDLYKAMVFIAKLLEKKIQVNFITLQWRLWKDDPNQRWNDLTVTDLSLYDLLDSVKNADQVNLEKKITVLEYYQSAWYTKYKKCFKK